MRAPRCGGVDGSNERIYHRVKGPSDWTHFVTRGDCSRGDSRAAKWPRSSVLILVLLVLFRRADIDGGWHRRPGRSSINATRRRCADARCRPRDERNLLIRFGTTPTPSTVGLRGELCPSTRWRALFASRKLHHRWLRKLLARARSYTDRNGLKNVFDIIIITYRTGNSSNDNMKNVFAFRCYARTMRYEYRTGFFVFYIMFSALRKMYNYYYSHRRVTLIEIINIFGER